MVLLEIHGTGPDPFYGHTIFRSDKTVGVVTSSTYGHRTKKVLALAYLTDGANPQNDGLSVSILGEVRAVTVLHQSAYDSTNAMLKRD